MGIFQSSPNQKIEKNEESDKKIIDKKLKNKEGVNKKASKVEIVEDSDTFILDKNLEYREVGNYISSIREIIDMTIAKEKKEAEEEFQKSQKNPDPKEEFKIKNIKKYHICSENLDKKIYNFGHCPMLYGLYNCYGSHESISLSADDFWLMIIQSFSIYVIKNSEELRNKFVNFEGKKTLNIILRESKIEQLTKEKYEECFNIFNEQISAYVGKDLVDNLQANFSTSTINEKTISQISIMTALQNYFEYKIYCIGCGFPSITLRGIIEDYEKILEKMKFLKNFELEWWYNILKPIIEKIIETKKCLTENRKESIDYEFWRQMIKKETKKKEEEEGSKVRIYEADFISGWIINFFPFDKKGNRRDHLNRFKVPNKLGFLVETNCKDIPGEILCVPVEIIEVLFNTNHNCYLYNGFLGFERDNNKRMKTVIGWFLAE